MSCPLSMWTRVNLTDDLIWPLTSATPPGKGGEAFLIRLFSVFCSLGLQLANAGRVSYLE